MLPIRTTHTNRLANVLGDSSPFTMLDEMRREFDRVFDRVLGSWDATLPAPRLDDAMRAWHPVMDVQETEKELRLTVEAPGLGPDDLRVDVSDDVLTIAGEKRVERDEREGAFHVVERRAGRFERRLTLPSYVDADRVSAEYENGVLTVTIPKRAEAARKSRRIEVKSSAFQKLLGGGSRKEKDAEHASGNGSERAER